MESINSIFTNNVFVSYPTNYAEKQKTTLSVTGKELFKTNEAEINKEISSYLDILYNESDDEIIAKSDKLKLNNAYSPMKSQTVHYGTFFI